MQLALLIGSALLAAGTLAHGEPPPERAAKMKAAHAKAQKACEGKPAEEQRACLRRELCAQARDAKACERRMETLAKAREACEAKPAAERRECMVRETCAQAKDAKACEQRMREAAARRDKVRAACKGKEGDAYKACIREQRGKT